MSGNQQTSNFNNKVTPENPIPKTNNFIDKNN